MRNYKDIDEYISTFPPGVQILLQQMRKTIHAAAPEAAEAIKYGIPTFVLNGNLAHFGGYKTHIGFYPAPVGIEAFKEETDRYVTGKGTMQFKLDEPLPIDLVTRIIKFRAEQSKKKGK